MLPVIRVHCAFCLVTVSLVHCSMRQTVSLILTAGIRKFGAGGMVDTIEDNAYYSICTDSKIGGLRLFTLVQSGNIFIVSENEYNNASDKVFNYDLDDSNTDMATGGSCILLVMFFDNIPGENY